MAAVNRVMLLGRVVAGPRTGDGLVGACVLFSVSTEGAGQDDAGQRHRVRVTGDQAAWCLARLRRGMLVHVEGELVACEREGEARAVVAAWLVQAVDGERRSGVPAQPAARHAAAVVEAEMNRREDQGAAASSCPECTGGGLPRAGRRVSCGPGLPELSCLLRDGAGGAHRFGALASGLPGMPPWSGEPDITGGEGSLATQPCLVPWGSRPTAVAGASDRCVRRMH
ncbi:MAG TPA: single-stranded DNA-binding protein [Nitratidesulfovibrio sp.]|nr:single-stranded DNA-binding protein [Nitratidesulfovibrio sp.]